MYRSIRANFIDAFGGRPTVFIHGKLEPERLDWFRAQFATDETLPSTLPERCMFIHVSAEAVVMHLRDGNKRGQSVDQDITDAWATAADLCVILLALALLAQHVVRLLDGVALVVVSVPDASAIRRRDCFSARRGIHAKRRVMGMAGSGSGSGAFSSAVARAACSGRCASSVVCRLNVAP